MQYHTGPLKWGHLVMKPNVEWESFRDFVNATAAVVRLLEPQDLQLGAPLGITWPTPVLPSLSWCLCTHSRGGAVQPCVTSSAVSPSHAVAKRWDLDEPAERAPGERAGEGQRFSLQWPHTTRLLTYCWGGVA